MALGFSLLADDEIFLVTKTVLGSWVGGKYVEATTESIDPIAVIWEPFNSGESTIVLPTGVSSSGAITIFSQQDLKISNDLSGNVADGDLIFLEDPVLVPTTLLYQIWDKAPWVTNAAFTLLKGHNEYVALRKEKT